MQAEYNLTDDRLRVWFDSRLSTEDYQAIKALGFAWWPRQGCFSATWTPAREDYLLGLGLEIDQTEQADDAEARAERYTEYADHAAQRSDVAYSAAHAISDMIPFGQPILVGHHSERHARRDQDKIYSNMRKGIDEQKKAAYWKERAEASIRNAEHKEKPDAILRKIQTLQADERKYQREIKLNHSSTHYARWLEHVQVQLAYHQARYEASGPIVAETVPLEIGGAVKDRYTWHEILRVNRKSVTVPSGYSWTDKVDLTDVKQVMSKSEVEAIPEMVKIFRELRDELSK